MTRVGNELVYMAVLFISIFILQTVRSMYIDVYSIESGHLDLFGYAINVGIGGLLTIYAVRKRLLDLMPITVLGFFFFLLLVNVAFNSEVSFVSVLFSRYGVLTWLSIGIWVSISISIIRVKIDSGGRGGLKLGPLAFYLLLLPVAWMVATYLSERIRTDSYQSVAANAIILICVSVLALHALVEPQAKAGIALYFPVYLLIVLFSFLVYAVALMQSTGIVAFWIVSVPVLLNSVMPRVRIVWRLTIAAVMLIALSWISTQFLVEEILDQTRFRELADGALSISSLKNRLDLVGEFIPQFQVAPFFGNYSAEVNAGLLQGQYIHSVPLSLLTHTGISGFLLVMAAWWMVFSARSKSLPVADPGMRLAFHLFLVVTALGSVYAFFSWAPFWFFLGYMCIRPIKTPQLRKVVPI
jgi:hypothetical protein